MDKLMAWLDGEMPPQEAKQFEKLLAEHPEWREQVQEMADIVGASKKLHLRVDPCIWDNYWEEIDNRLQRRVGWLVALVGSVILIIWGLVKVLVYAQNDWVRGGLLLVVVGLVVLFIAVLRGRFLELPKDRYTRIRR
jgi:uncharacterized membrane protein